MIIMQKIKLVRTLSVLKKLNRVYFQATGHLKGHKVRLAADQYMPLGPTSLPEGILFLHPITKAHNC